MPLPTGLVEVILGPALGKVVAVAFTALFVVAAVVS